MFLTQSDLLSYCEATIEASPYVKMDLLMVDQVFDIVKKSKPTNWSFLLHGDSKTPTDWLIDFAFNASLNGGYYFEDKNEIKKWHLDSSGSKALTAWISALHRDGMTPWHDVKDPCITARDLKQRMEGLPFANERLKICCQFSEKSRYNLLDDFVEELIKNDTVIIDLSCVNKLAEIYPAGFIADPFKKKAILALIFFSDYMETQGKIIDWKAGIPADYQLPRILTWKKIINITKEMEIILDSSRLLNVVSDPVIHYRCATIIAVEEIAKQLKTQSKKVDGALFSLLKNKIDVPPMKINSMWF